MSAREPDYNQDGNRHLDVKNDYVYAKHPTGISIFAMRLLRIAIAQCRRGDREFYEYSFRVQDLAKMVGCDPSNIYRTADELTDQLLQIILKPGGGIAPGKKGKKFQIFDLCDYDEDGTITIRLHDNMRQFLLNLDREFTEIPLAPLLLMRSKYAIRIYELLCQKIGKRNMPYNEKGVSVTLTLEEIRTVTQTEDKKIYDHVSHLKEKVIMPALADIEENAGWKIIRMDIKKGRKITGIRLEIWDRVGYDVIEHCKRTGEPLPGRYNNQVPGQRSLFDGWAET